MPRADAMRYGAGLLLIVGFGALLGAPGYAPAAVAVGLTTAFVPLTTAWRGARGTALRPAVIWGCVAVALGVAAQGLGALEPLEAGRPIAGHLTYLSELATLAALTSVLNARTPGSGAWAILMLLLVLVFLIPWLELPLLLRNSSGLARLRLDAPWSLFYGLLVLAGVTNYLPTRYGPAAVCLAAGFVLEYLGLARHDWSLTRRARIWSAVAWTLAAAIWIAESRSRSRGRAAVRSKGLEATWLWFRDAWGVVWALRVQERFNRAASSARWPVRLSWFGVVPVESVSESSAPPESLESAIATLSGLLRRFATAERIEAESNLDSRAGAA
jgi:hypothetical protein